MDCGEHSFIGSALAVKADRDRQTVSARGSADRCQLAPPRQVAPIFFNAQPWKSLPAFVGNIVPGVVWRGPSQSQRSGYRNHHDGAFGVLFFFLPAKDELDPFGLC